MRETSLDEICETIGYAATRVVAVWFAGRALYVPPQPDPDHPLRLLLGVAAFRRLVEGFAGDQVKIPLESADGALVRDRDIAIALAEGRTPAQVGALVGLSTRRVEQIRSALVDRGWLAYAEGFKPGRGKVRPVPAVRLEIFGTGGSRSDSPGVEPAAV